MSECGRELVASDEPTVVAKPLLDAIVMEDGQSDGCFSNPSSTDEGHRGEVFRETNDPLNQLATSEAGPWCRWGRFARYPGCKRGRLGSLVI